MVQKRGLEKANKAHGFSKAEVQTISKVLRAAGVKRGTVEQVDGKLWRVTPTTDEEVDLQAHQRLMRTRTKAAAKGRPYTSEQQGEDKAIERRLKLRAIKAQENIQAIEVVQTKP